MAELKPVDDSIHPLKVPSPPVDGSVELPMATSIEPSTGFNGILSRLINLSTGGDGAMGGLIERNIAHFDNFIEILVKLFKCQYRNNLYS
jgi:hypothetical protein